LYFDTSKIDKQLNIILIRYNNSTTEYQNIVNIKIAVFFDKYNLYKNIAEYRVQYRNPITVLDYILLQRGFEAILVLILLELLVEY
jgi:hypothetical protein